MKHGGLWVAFVSIGVWVGVAAQQQAGADRSALLRSLPRVTDLPSSYRALGTFASRGAFYAAGTPLHRVDDGDAHHGLPATAAWATKPKDKRAQTQGVVYGVEDGRIISAGYVIRTGGPGRRQELPRADAAGTGISRGSLLDDRSHQGSHRGL